MKSLYLKPAVIGAFIGLALGLTFVIAIHKPVDFLVNYVFIPSLPCWYVAQLLGLHLPASLNWLAWMAGVLTMGLIGAILGLAMSGARRLLRRLA